LSWTGTLDPVAVLGKAVAVAVAVDFENRFEPGRTNSSLSSVSLMTIAESPGTYGVGAGRDEVEARSKENCSRPSESGSSFDMACS